MGIIEQIQLRLEQQEQEIKELRQEISYLKKRLTAWVDNAEASRITGLSIATLDRRRLSGIFVLGVDWKKDGTKIIFNSTRLEAYHDSHKVRKVRRLIL